MVGIWKSNGYSGSVRCGIYSIPLVPMPGFKTTPVARDCHADRAIPLSLLERTESVDRKPATDVSWSFGAAVGTFQNDRAIVPVGDGVFNRNDHGMDPSSRSIAPSTSASDIVAKPVAWSASPYGTTSCPLCTRAPQL